jgi:hypothetical protein
MKLDLSEDQGMTVESFVRFLDEQSSVARTRATLAFGFEQAPICS